MGKEHENRFPDVGVLLSYVAFLSVLIGLLLPVTCYPDRKSRITAARKNLADLEGATSVFHVEYQTNLPSTNWPAELTGSKNAVINTRRIVFLYGRLDDGTPKDPWNQPYSFVPIDNDRGYRSLKFYSRGPDGIAGTGDDVFLGKPD